MKKSKGSEDNEAVIDEDKQDKDKVANEESPPDTAGDDSDAKDESLTWDVTKAQACVEQLLDLFPDMTLEKARSLLELVCDDYIDDSEVLQTSAANATLAKVFNDPKHAKAKNAGGDSLDNFLPLLTDLRAEAKAWKKEQRDARRKGDAAAAKKASVSDGLITDLKARYAGEQKRQKQAENARQDTLLRLQAIEASRDQLSGQVAEAYKKAKKSDEKVEKLKTQVKVFKESKVVGVDGSEGQKMAMQADLDSFRNHMQSQVDRLTIDVETRLEEASKQQTNVLLQMSEQIARAVAAETSAQANRIEQMFGAVMAAQASSTQLLTKESNQDKEVTHLGTTTTPALLAPDVHELRRIEANGRRLLQVLIMARDRQRIAYTHNAFAAFKAHTQESIIIEMSTRSGIYKNASNYASMEGDGYVLVSHNITQLAAKLSTMAEHMEHKSEPDYTLGFTVSRDIHFDKHGNIIVPAHVEPLIFREQGYGSSTPTGSRHEQRKQKAKKRREGSNQHPTLAELTPNDSEPDTSSGGHRSAESGDDLDPEDQPPGTVQKSSGTEGFSLDELLALEAEDGKGHKEEEEDEEGSDTSVYLQVEDEDMVNETTLQLPPKCHLHQVGTLRIKQKADWALPLAESILKAEASFLANKKVAPRLRSAVEKRWEEAPVRKELTPTMRASIVEWDKEASMKGKHKSRRLSMEQYEQEAWDEWTPSTMQEPKTNIYLKTWPNRTTMQVFNTLRSKLTYEAMLLKSRGATQSWHERARPFHDGTVNIQRLAEFAQEHLGLPIGDPEYENSGGDYPNDPLPTHDGLTKWDYCRTIWIRLRKLSFDSKGILIVKPMQSRAKKEDVNDEKKNASKEVLKKKEEKVDKPADEPDIEDAADPGADEDSLSLSDDEKEAAEIERAARRAAKQEIAARTKRRQTLHEKELQSERDSLRDENKQLKDGIRVADNKLDSVDRQKLPLLERQAATGYKSGNEFRTTAKGNRYTSHQMIAHILGHAKNAQGKPREKKYKSVANDMQIVKELLEGEMEHARNAGRPMFKTNDDEWAAAVMERFWIAWGKRYPSAPPESRLETSRHEWHSEWADMIFWYGQSPEDMLDSLLAMQARAVKLKIACTNEHIKTKFRRLVLPKTTAFTTGKPPDIAAVFATPGVELTQNHIAEWYGGADLDQEQALTAVRNKQHLADIRMGIDEDSFLDAKGMLGPLPVRYRNAKYGVKRSNKKKNESASVEQAEQAESEREGAGAECGSVDYAAAVGATGELPQSLKDYIDSRLTALAAQKPQSSKTPRASGPNGKIMPWDTQPTKDQYKEHYVTYQGDTMCPFPSVYHNLEPYRAQMKKLGKQSCACVQGYDINTGDARGDDYTQQATPSERKRVWKIFKAIEDESSEQWNATPRSDVGARERIRQLAREQRYEEKLKVIRHWQSIKQAKQQGGRSSASSEVDTSAVQRPPAPQQVPVQAATVPPAPAPARDTMNDVDDGERMTEQDAGEMSTILELDSVDHPPSLCVNPTCSSCPVPRTAWNDGDTIHIPLPPAGAHSSDATERDTESPGKGRQNGKGKVKGKGKGKGSKRGKRRRSPLPRTDAHTSDATERDAGSIEKGKGKKAKNMDGGQAKAPVISNVVKVTTPAPSSLREIQQATLGFSTPFDASSLEYENRMKSLVKEELQKNEGDLPDDLACWLQQQTTAMHIECMEGLDKLASLREEERQQAQRLLEYPALPSSAQGSGWTTVTRNKKKSNSARTRRTSTDKQLIKHSTDSFAAQLAAYGGI